MKNGPDELTVKPEFIKIEIYIGQFRDLRFLRDQRSILLPFSPLLPRGARGAHTAPSLTAVGNDERGRR